MTNEGLPLKYIIIAILAALIFGIILNVTSIFGQGITGSTILNFMANLTG
jgi:hypothetical protein